MTDNIKAAALAANLQGEQKAQVDDLVKALFVHKELSNLPKDVAAKKAAALPAGQKQDLENKFGNEDPATKPSRGWLGTAWHYATAIPFAPIKYGFKGLNEVSDAMTRTYRAIAIPLSEGRVDFEWAKANDKGDKVYNEGRIDKAKAMYGEPAVTLAMRIKAGEDPEKIWATASPEQQKYLMLDDPNNKVIPGVTDIQKERALWNETLGVVDRAHYSLGRQVANLVLPEQLEKNGFIYGAVSGTWDLAYRTFADPLIVGGKIRSLYSIGKYSLDAVVGAGKVATYFEKPQVVGFWDQYGAKLANFTKAQAERDPQKIAEARQELATLAPEFGPEVVKAFQKSDVVDANSAKAYFLNTEEAVKVLKGSAERKRVILPKLDTARKARVAVVTEANKMISLDRWAPSIVSDLYGSLPTTDGIVKTLSEDGKLLGEKIKETASTKNFLRYPSEVIGLRLDRAKAKFNIAPLFKDDMFDVLDKDASTQIYRLARLVMTKQDSKMIAETFDTVADIGQRKEMVKGLWETIAEVRGLNLTESGQKVTRQVLGKGESKFAVSNFGDDFADIGAIPSDYTSKMTTPNLVDIDRAAARSGLIGKMLNQANKEWVDKMTGYWSFLTLAGPRYAIRNAGEDLMVHLAVGGSPWGLAKSRYLSTRVNTALEAARKTDGFVDSPLGSMMRMLNKSEAAKYEKQLAGVDDNIRMAKEQIKIKAAEAKAATDPAVKTAISEEIATLKKNIAGGAVEQTRRIMATSLTSGRINRYRQRLGLKPMFEEEADILAEHLIYGNLDNAAAEASEGAFNFATGGDFVTRSTNFTRTHGVRSEALVINDPKIKKVSRAKGDSGYTNISLGSGDDASMITWLMRINYYANDELGAIAVANLGNTAADKERALNKIMEWMDKNPSFRKEAQLAARGIDEKTQAEIVYRRAKEVFEKRGKDPLADKEVNLDLLNKIRVQNEEGDWVISGKLSLDDLPHIADDMPEYVLGPKLVPISDSGNVTASTITKGWTWLGMANARMSREPIVFEEIIRMRKQMKASGLEDAYIKSVVSKVDSTNLKKVEAATTRAKRQFAELVEDRAVAQTLAYVDNPLVRTQIAFSARNFSRFYRATEDFYRRMYRVARYNPMAIRKAALTMDGISHNGWIQEDDQGEKYFVYPGLEPIYRAVQGVMQGLGVDAEFKTPMPINFGAQVKMLTPSLNQDSLVPTFNGPLAGVSIKTLANLVDIFGAPGAADKITELGLGKYAVGQSYLSAFLPAHINRLYEAMDKDERDSQYASAWRKAVTYLEASGHGLPKKYDELGQLIPPTIQEQETYRQQVKNTTLTILGTRFVYGFILPASPQVQLKDDMAKWVKDNNRANFKQAWNSLIDEYAGDYDKAMAKWTQLFPNEIPFTIPESDRSTVAIVRYAEESGNFVDQNKDLFKAYPQGAAFLIPNKSGFSWDAYKTMKDMGIKYNKRVDDYLREVQTAADLQTYYAKKNEYETNLQNMPTDFERSMARQEFQDWAKVFKAGRPLLTEELSQGSQKAIARQNAINDLRSMLNDPKVTVRGPVQKSLKNMLDLYDSFQLQKDALSNMSGTSNLVSFMKDDTIIQMRELAKKNENTKSAYNTLFASLLGDTNG
jgi:hypothetical protein